MSSVDVKNLQRREPGPDSERVFKPSKTSWRRRAWGQLGSGARRLASSAAQLAGLVRYLARYLVRAYIRALLFVRAR